MGQKNQQGRPFSLVFNYKLYSALYCSQPIILVPPNPSHFLVDKLSRVKVVFVALTGSIEAATAFLFNNKMVFFVGDNTVFLFKKSKVVFSYKNILIRQGKNYN